MNLPTSYIKSFSKGQITIPKRMRNALGVGDEFWLKLSFVQGKMIAEPAEKNSRLDKAEFKKMLLNMKTDWFTEKDEADYKKIRSDIKKRSKKNRL